MDGRIHMGDIFVYSVVFTGISVVFLALILLVFIIFSFGKSVGWIEKIAQKAKIPAPKPQVSLPAVKNAVRNTASQKPGPSPEIVAAISAAVASVMGTNHFQIRSIRQRKKSDRFAWRTFASHAHSSFKRG